MGDEKLQLFGEFELDRARGCLLRAGRPVHLRPQAYKALKYLAENRGRLVSKDELIDEVWGGRAVTDDSLVQCLKAVRQALGEGSEKYLRTERGRGYIFDLEAVGAEQETASVAWTRRVDAFSASVETAEEPADAPAAMTSAVVAGSLGSARVRSTWRRVALMAACLLAVLLAAGFAYYLFEPGGVNPKNAAGVRSLAVLPFKPLVRGGGDEVLEVGMADRLIAKFGELSEVTVRPLSSARRFGGLEQDSLEAGKQLGVQAVLDGTVQRSRDRIVVTARLASVDDGRQLWQGHFDAPFSDILSIQDTIFQEVAAALKPKLMGSEEGRPAKRYTENIEAYELYLRGRFHALKRRLPDTQLAISYFQQAIALDPFYALAYVGLADAHLSALAADLPPDAFLPQARAAAEKAIEIDDVLAAAHAQLGFIMFWYDWDLAESERKIQRALELNPEDADTHLFYAHLLSNTGRHEQALAEVQYARELDPLNLRINALEGQFLIHAGRTDEALERLWKILEVEPNYFLACLFASSAYIEKGMYPEAIHEARKAIEISGARSTYSEAFLGYALAKSGKEAEARAVLEGFSKSSAERYVSPYDIALVYNGLGLHHEALGFLEQAYAQRSPKMVFLKVEPKWNNLRSNPRFQDLLRRVGLTP